MTATEPTTAKPKDEPKPTATTKPTESSAAENPKDNGCITIVETDDPPTEEIIISPKPSADIVAQKVAEYINKFRTEQGDVTATVIPGLTEYCKYRCTQLKTNFAHKYRVLIEDAEMFKIRMDTEVGFLSELNGLFSNRTEWHPRPMFEATEENCEAFRLWLEMLWAELPEALPTQTAAELVGHNPQRIHELIREKTLHGIKIGSTQYCVKEEFICYMATPQKLSNPRTERYKELIREFKYIQRRERENEQRRRKRKMKNDDA